MRRVGGPNPSGFCDDVSGHKVTTSNHYGRQPVVGYIGKVLWEATGARSVDGSNCRVVRPSLSLKPLPSRSSHLKAYLVSASASCPPVSADPASVSWANWPEQTGALVPVAAVVVAIATATQARFSVQGGGSKGDLVLIALRVHAHSHNAAVRARAHARARAWLTNLMNLLRVRHAIVDLHLGIHPFSYRRYFYTRNEIDQFSTHVSFLAQAEISPERPSRPPTSRSRRSNDGTLQKSP